MNKWGVFDSITIVFGAKCVLFLISFKLKGIQEKKKKEVVWLPYFIKQNESSFILETHPKSDI